MGALRVSKGGGIKAGGEKRSDPRTNSHAHPNTHQKEIPPRDRCLYNIYIYIPCCIPFIYIIIYIYIFTQGTLGCHPHDYRDFTEEAPGTTGEGMVLVIGKKTYEWKM